MTKRIQFFSAVAALFLASVSTPAAASNEASALEFYKLALTEKSCDMFLIVMTDFSGTTAAKLAQVSYKSCIKNEALGSGTNGTQSSNNSPTDDELEETEDAGQDDIGPASCRAYWDGDSCVTNKAYLIQYLQEALQGAGCNIGSADGVWGGKTTKAMAAANKNFGTYFRKSSSAAKYGRMIKDLQNTNDDICYCPSGKILASNGSCVRKKSKVKVNTSRGISDFDVQNVAPNDTLNLRSHATSSSSIVTKIPYNAKNVTVDEGTCRATSVRWVYVNWKGWNGWVASRYLRSQIDGGKPCI
jgi:hypothetical protein